MPNHRRAKVTPRRRPARSGAGFTQKTFKQALVNLYHDHLTALRISVHNLAQHASTTLMTIIAIGVALSIPLGFQGVIKNIQGFADQLTYQGTLTVYFDPKTPEPEIFGIKAKLSTQYPAVISTEYISADKALNEFKAQAQLDDILALLPNNPLNPMLVANIDPEKTTKADAEQLKRAFAAFPGVKSVDLDYEWVQKLQGFIQLGRIIATCLGLIVGLGVIVIIANMIRLSLEKHRDELEVLNIIGATRAFIRRPFLYRGLFYGICGAVIAAVIVSVATLAIATPIQNLARLYDGVIAIHPLSFGDVVLLASYSCLLGWLGSWLAFRQQQKAFTC